MDLISVLIRLISEPTLQQQQQQQRLGPGLGRRGRSLLALVLVRAFEVSLMMWSAFRAYLFIARILKDHFMVSVRLDSKDPLHRHVERYLEGKGSIKPPP